MRDALWLEDEILLPCGHAYGVVPTDIWIVLVVFLL